MRINPIIVGRGMAGQALERAVGIVGTLEEDLEILPATFASRGTPLKEYIKGDAAVNLLCIANPHGLHVATLAEGVSAGFQAALVDKEREHCNLKRCETRVQLEKNSSLCLPISINTFLFSVRITKVGKACTSQASCWLNNVRNVANSWLTRLWINLLLVVHHVGQQ
jgi:hypothetical protein